MEPASNAQTTIDWVPRILKEERDIVISSRPLEATAFQIENIRMAYVFYQSGLSMVNVMYTVDDPKKRAVGFKLSDRMDVPSELASGSSSPAGVEAGRNPFAAPTSASRTSTDPRTGSARSVISCRPCPQARGLRAAACWRADRLPVRFNAASVRWCGR